MGTAASVVALPQDVVLTKFREACKWQESNKEAQDDQIVAYLQQQFSDISLHNNSSIIDDDKTYSIMGKSDEIRSPQTTTTTTSTITSIIPITSNNLLSSPSSSNIKNTNNTADPIDDSLVSCVSQKSQSKETFMDSVYVKNWLSKEEADDLYNHLYEAGKHMKPKMDKMQATNSDIKYPLSTITYGFKRDLDGALALDRWGSYHEGWCRTLEPTDLIIKLCQKARYFFSLPEYALNSIVVNYYWDGAHTHIPAHRDTIACLENNSRIHCLSLGATRDFILCDNKDSGKYKKEELNVFRSWNVSHGDMYAVGPKTNATYCHAVPQDESIQNLRISIILRTVTKSFIHFENAVNRSVTMADGNTVKYFKAECILTDSIDEMGICTHIADLVIVREKKKLEKSLLIASSSSSSSSSSSLSSSSSSKAYETLKMIISNNTKMDDDNNQLSNRSHRSNHNNIDTALPSSKIVTTSSSSSSSSMDLTTIDHTITNSTSINATTPTTATTMTTDAIISPRIVHHIELEDPGKYFMGEGDEVPIDTLQEISMSSKTMIIHQPVIAL